jgi:[ribosomal protein S5]-alanine N-acetyltransferase
MALFRFAADPPVRPLLRTGQLLLRPPRPEDFDQWLELRQKSRAFLAPWEPEWSEADLTRTSFRQRTKRAIREIANDEAYPLFIFDHGGHVLVGGITLGLVRRGVAQAATLGYWLGEAHAGRGHMGQAVQAVLDLAFGELALHRVEAACLPSNLRSARLLERAGFRSEGLARRYLKIAGQWSDHLLFAILTDDPRPVDRVA